MSSVKGIEAVKQKLNKLASKSTAENACRRLAELGANVASGIFAISDYDGENDVSVRAKKIKDGYAVEATGGSVLFREYGSGVIGEGHPDARALGYGPGTWSDGPQGKGHWDDPHGWHIPVSRIHTYGNPPAMAMYTAREEIEGNILRVVKEEMKNV